MLRLTFDKSFTSVALEHTHSLEVLMVFGHSTVVFLDNLPVLLAET